MYKKNENFLMKIYSFRESEKMCTFLFMWNTKLYT